MAVNKPVLEEDQTCVNTSRLIETVLYIPRSLVNAHHANVGASPQRFFQSCDRIICIGIRATGTSVHLHNAQLRATECPRQPGSSIDRHLLSGYWIYSNLTAKEQLIRIADIEIEDPCVFEEELALLRNEDFERRQIERLKVHLGIGKIRVACQIQDEVRSKAVLNIDSARQREFGVLPCLLVVAGQSVWFHSEESSTADVLDAPQISRLRGLGDPKSSPVSTPEVFFILSTDKL